MDMGRPALEPAGAPTELGACAVCGERMVGTYCHRCGQKKFNRHDLSVKEFLEHALHEVTHLDTKIVKTLKYLLLRPGFLTAEYLAGRADLYVKPLRLYLTVSLVSFIILTFWPVANYTGEFYSRRSPEFSAAMDRLAAAKRISRPAAIKRFNEHLHRRVSTWKYLLAALLPLWLMLLYRRPKKLLVEHLIFSLHFGSFFHLSELLTMPLLDDRGWGGLAIAFALGWAYLYFAVKRVHDETGAKAIFKSLLINLGYIGFRFVLFGTMVWLAIRDSFVSPS